jgi:hypothetical protein
VTERGSVTQAVARAARRGRPARAPVSIRLPALDGFERTFFQELVHGAGSFGANVILGVDADGDGQYETDDLGWHDEFSDAALGDDTFVEMKTLTPVARI